MDPPSRSNFDLSFKTRFTATPGALYPIMVQRCLPGDHFEFNMYHLVKTLAMKAPLMGRMSLNFDVFFAADRLMMPEFRNGRLAPAQFASKPSDSLGIPNVGGEPNTDFVYPYFRFVPQGYYDDPTGISSAEYTDSPALAVAPSSLMDFLGFPVGFQDLHYLNNSAQREVIGTGGYNGFNMNSIKFNAMPWLQFWNIYLNYYINPQESSFAVMTAGAPREWLTAADVPVGRPITEDDVNAYRLNPWSFETATDVVPVEDFADTLYQVTQGVKDLNTLSYAKFRRMFNEDVATRMGGIPLRCYRPDYFSNFISSTAYNRSVNNAGSVVIQDGKFNMTQVRFANKLQKLAERVFVAGSRYGEFIRALFGVDTNDQLDVPEFLGSVRTYMDFQDIVNQSGDASASPIAENSSQFLGGSAGRGISSDSSRKFYVNATEYGYLYVLFSIVPEPDYFEGLHKSATKIFFSDEFNPQLDRIGWQPIFESEYYALGKDYSNYQVPIGDVYVPTPWDNDVYNPFKTSFVYQPAWLEYMTRTNELHGEFATTLNFWTLGRTFDRSTIDGNPSDITPTAYIYPGDFSTPFVDQSVSAQNFMVQVGFDLFAKRAISKKLMPNLG